ncbi:MAG TPA: carbamoyltransferase N-terminal domain-containing protein, partial [Flavitalea sp.]|nr:carbamoyltransferase N-terminal domain-containing protein [Flavitalea sp.]
MYILGLNAYHADSSSAIFKDGNMLAAIEEERFTRIKHWAGFPVESVKFCLREAGIKLTDVGYITIGRDPGAKLANKLKYLLKNPSLVGGAIGRLNNSRQVSSLKKEFKKIDDTAKYSVLRNKIKNIEHHRSHLASAFFASPFSEAAILSIDGSGDFTTTMIATGKGNRIDIIDSIDFPVSCGLFYTAFTQFLGFPHYGDEYKVMGLAPYGKPVYADNVKKVLEFLPDGLFTWHDEYFVKPTKAGFSYHNNQPSVGNLFSEKFIAEFGKPRKMDDDLTQYHKDLAASVQKVTEELIFHILIHLRKKTGLKNICVAGGVAQNSVANGKIAAATGFENVYIPSAGHDAGISIGSALYMYNHILGMPRSAPLYSAYTGSRFSNDEIESVLKAQGVNYKRLDDDELYDVVTDKLVEPGVVGWFSGRAEFGPRALGGRSIL